MRDVMVLEKNKKRDKSVIINDSHTVSFDYSKIVADNAFKINTGYSFRISNLLNAGDLSKSGYSFSPDEKAETIYEIIKLNPEITEFTVVEDGVAIGFLTRTAFNEILGGKYGFSLFSKNPVREIMKTDFLSVDYYMPVEHVSKLSMQRSFDQLYNPIVVEWEGSYFGIVTVKDLLDACIKMTLAERDEIALMRDNLKIGIFFMDRNFIIQDQYSVYLEELFTQTGLCGKNFADIISSSVTEKELSSIKDYFDMIFEGNFDQSLLDEINPLTEFQYNGSDSSGKKVFQCAFAAIKKDNGEVFVLVSVYDITVKIELQRQLAEEENRRHEEMMTISELLQIETNVFQDFIDDMEDEFTRIDNTLKLDEMSAHDKVVKIYQSVHAIKSNAFILGQNTFGNKVHNLETNIKLMREQKEIDFNKMLNLAMEIEKINREKDKFITTMRRINSHKSGNNTEGVSQAQHILIETLTKTAAKVSDDLGKKVKFTVGKIDEEAIEKCQRRIIKEVLIQLVRNSIVHGIESPEERNVIGKKKTGSIHLSIKMKENFLHIKLGDDGRGIDYKKIAEKAIKLNLIKPEDKNNEKSLLKLIFSPGFSTSENEGIHAGRGIGLSLVKSRISENNGSLKVQTVRGKGTIFHMYFPVIEPS
jgi:two-component system chemotaxis sensor kinase CheA